MNSIAAILEPAIRRYTEVRAKQFERDAKFFAMIFPPTKEGRKSAALTLKQPYVPSDRAKALLKRLRKAGKRTKEALRLLDEEFDQLEGELRDYYSDE